MSRGYRSFSSLRPGDILPEQDNHEVALHYVISVLCFLACLAALVVMASDRAATGWSRDIRSEITIQVRPSGMESGAAAAARAAEILSGVRGVTEATAIEPEKAKALVKPWLGDAILDDLPMPNLVAVRLDREAPATTSALQDAITANDIEASIDDHSLWLKDIEKSALTIRLISISIFIIIGTTCAAVVGFATRAGLAAHHTVVDVLSLCGAPDTFIARRFQFRFARMAFESGLIGAAAAAVVMALIKLTGSSQSLSLALPFAWPDLLALLPCPFIVALIAAVTARFVTLRLLGGTA